MFRLKDLKELKPVMYWKDKMSQKFCLLLFRFKMDVKTLCDRMSFIL